MILISVSGPISHTNLYNVIYKFPCNGYNSIYFGWTNRNLLIRCSKHLGINRKGREIASLSPSSIKDHVKQRGHTALD